MMILMTTIDNYDDDDDDVDSYDDDEVSLHRVAVREAAGFSVVCTEGPAHLLLEPDSYHHQQTHDNYDDGNGDDHHDGGNGDAKPICVPGSANWGTAILHNRGDFV